MVRTSKLQPAWWAAACAVLAVPAAGAQPSSACDQLKDKLAARIDATGVRGYSIEALPAATPLPKDGRVIGNCAGGAFRIVYRRFGGGSAAAGEPAAKPTPAPAPAPAVVAAAPAIVAAPPPPPPPPPAPPPAPAPAPEPAPPAPEPAPPPPSPASAASVAADAPAAPASTPPAAAATEPGSWFDGVWAWLGAGAGLLLAAWGIARVRYHRQFDAAGLPRGPRLS